ncbi:MAG: hypothetical protein AAF242_14965 [Bacteroidota bacterium]
MKNLILVLILIGAAFAIFQPLQQQGQSDDLSVEAAIIEEDPSEVEAISLIEENPAEVEPIGEVEPEGEVEPKEEVAY